MIHNDTYTHTYMQACMHYIHEITLDCIALQYIFNYITLHCIALHTLQTLHTVHTVHTVHT